MIKNTYELIRQPTATEVLNNPACSFWLQGQVKEAMHRDCLDFLRDIEVLHAIVKKRFEDLTV